MNYFILIIVICLFVCYKINTSVYDTIINSNEKINSIGIYNSSINKNYIKLIHKTLKNNNINLKLINYSNKYTLYDDLNCNKIQFIVDYEHDFYDNYFGLNRKYKFNNINFVCGLFYNYFYFLLKKNENTNNITLDNLNELNNKLIIGVTQESLKYLKFIFQSLNINIDEYKDNLNSNNLYYKILGLEDLIYYYSNNVIDGIFILGHYNDSILKLLIKDKNHIFIDLNYENNNDIFYQDEEIILKDYYYLINQFSVSSKKLRVNLIGNKFKENDILAEKITKIYFENFNYILNTILNKKLNSENYIINPIDLIYINENIKINGGSYKYFKSLNYIKDELENDEKNKFKCYWKYDTIGLKKFIL